MKAKIENKRLLFTDYTEKEIEKIHKLLFWPGSEYSSSESLLFSDESGNPYTFWGLYNILAQYVDLEVDNLPIISYIEPGLIPKNILNEITLYDYQIAAIRKSLLLKKGILEIPTGGGKTEIILAVLKLLFDWNEINRALIIVPTVGLVQQFYQRSLLRGFFPGSVGRIYGGVQETDCPIIVGVVNSLNQGYHQGGKIKEIVEKADAIIHDETQHLQARTHLELALGAINAEYLLCFSGSPFRSEEILDNSGDALTYGVAGGVIFSIPLQYLVRLGLVAEPIVFFKSLPGVMAKYPGRYSNIYKSGISQNEVRNQNIISFNKQFQDIGFPTLILTKLKEHGLNILNQAQNPKSIYISGGAQAVLPSGDEFTVDYETFFKDFEMGIYDTIVATPVFDEGIDLPSVQAFINAGGEKSRIKQMQRLGRSLRKKYDGINRVYTVDFIDRSHVYLYSHYKKRLKIYENLGIKVIYNEFEFNRLLHDHVEAKKNKE